MPQNEARCKFNFANGVRCPGKAEKSGYCAKHRRTEAVLVKQLTRENRRYARNAYGDVAVSEDHVAAQPHSGYLWELRRTAAKIIACEEEISQLTSSDIIWGQTIEETKNAAVSYDKDGRPFDASYDLKRYEARINMWVQLSLRERAHYANLCRIGINAGLEDRRIKLEEFRVLQLQRVITNVLSRAGLDPDNPGLRSVVREELIALEAAGPDSESVATPSREL